MPFGIGGGAFGFRGGISTRGIGVGVGPFSAGTSWRGRGSGGGGGGFLAWLITGALVFFVAAWPYLLGTYIAVQCGAWNPSTTRFVVGWCFEVVYIAGLVAWVLAARKIGGRKAADEARRISELTASGAVYEATIGRSVVYRHGSCTVNHRSFGTAQKCSNTFPSSALEPSPPTPPPARDHQIAGQFGLTPEIVWPAAILAVGLVAGLVILAANPIHSPAQDAASKPCPTAVSTAAAVTMPQLIGQNAGCRSKIN